MFPFNTTDIQSAWFFEPAINSDNPAAGKCSIEAAVSRGLVQRHEEAGHLYLPMFGKMKLSYVAAIALGLVDQAAVDIIDAQPGTNAPAPFIREDHKHPDDVAAAALPAYAGSPVGDVVVALLALIASPASRDAAEVFAKALEVAISATAGAHQPRTGAGKKAA